MRLKISLKNFIILFKIKKLFMENKSGCLLCGKEIIYLQTPENSQCVFCKNEFIINEHCVDGHYICNKCHSSDTMDIIEKYCLHADSSDPIEMAITIMCHPSVKMHGPEHHFLMPAVMLTAFYNITNQRELLIENLKKARERAELIPGSFCGSHGNCGAGVGAGIFISLITKATPLSNKEWQLSNLMTSKSLGVIALHGGPRCCKRNIYLSIIEAAKFVKENLNIEIPITLNITCDFNIYNKECLHKNCIFYKLNQTKK